MAKFGWNTKGTLGVPILDSFNTWLQEKDLGEIYLRIQGGTISQKDFNLDWTDSAIQKWADLYSANPEVKLVFVINFNQSVEDSNKLLKRFEDKGCVFEFIEMSNENYLNKYRLSKDKPEVTPRTKDMSPEKYIALCDEYLPYLEGRNILYQLAPNKSRNIDQYYNFWNQIVLNETLESEHSNYSMHVYLNAGFRTELIDEVQAVIGDKVLAITEFGAADAADGVQKELTDEEFIKLTVEAALY